MLELVNHKFPQGLGRFVIDSNKVNAGGPITQIIFLLNQGIGWELFL